MTKRKTDPTNGPKLAADRRLPRHPNEIGLLAPEAQAWIADLRERAVLDLGGDENVSALRREVLEIGLTLEAVGLMLAREIAEKAKRSRSRGSVPNPSRYRATPLVQRFLEGAARQYERVGLNRRAKRVNLDDYLKRSTSDATPPEAPADPSASGTDERHAATDVAHEDEP